MAADKQRGKQTVRDMVLSLAVILLAAGVIYAFVPHDGGQDPVKPVSYRVELNSARRSAPYPVAAPQGLSEKWRATSVTYEPGSAKGSAWHLGFMTPDDQYAAVEQSDTAHPDRYVHDVTQGAHRTQRTVRAGGETWTRYEGKKYDALVRVDNSGAHGEHGKGHPGRHTTVVTGTAGAEQLRQMAGALRTHGAGKQIADGGAAAQGSGTGE